MWMLFLSAAMAACDMASLDGAMRVLDADLTNRWWAVEEQAERVTRAVKCVKEPLGGVTLIRLHHQWAVAAHIQKDFDTAAKHLVAAWLISPNTELPPLLPSTSPARGRYAALQEEILTSGVVVPLENSALVDGHNAAWVYEGLPMVVQQAGKKTRIME